MTKKLIISVAMGATLFAMSVQAQMPLENWLAERLDEAAIEYDVDQRTGLDKIIVNGSSEILPGSLGSPTGRQRLSLPEDLDVDRTVLFELIRRAQAFPSLPEEPFKVRSRPTEPEKTASAYLVKQVFGQDASTLSFGPTVGVGAKKIMALSVARPGLPPIETFITFDQSNGDSSNVQAKLAVGAVAGQGLGQQIFDNFTAQGLNRSLQDKLARRFGQDDQKYEIEAPELDDSGFSMLIAGEANGNSVSAGDISCGDGRVNDSNPEKDCLVSVGVVKADWRVVGSGVLIDKQGTFFLTAAHLVEPSVRECKDFVTCRVHFGNDKKGSVVFDVVDAVELHLGGFDSDLAILKLAPLDGKPAWNMKPFASPVLKGVSESELGQYLHYGAGFGHAHELRKPSGRKRRGVLSRCPDNICESTGEDFRGANLKSSDFDRERDILMRTEKASLPSGETVLSSPCFQDSGSPIFVSTQDGSGGVRLAVTAIVISSGSGPACEGVTLAVDLSKKKVWTALNTAITTLEGQAETVYATLSLNPKTTRRMNLLSLRN